MCLITAVRPDAGSMAALPDIDAAEATLGSELMAAVSNLRVMNAEHTRTIFSGTCSARGAARARRSRPGALCAGALSFGRCAHRGRAARRAGNAQMIDIAMRKFVESADKARPKLVEAAEARDYSQLHLLSHRLKGASGYISGDRVRCLALLLQRTADALIPDDARHPAAEELASFASTTPREKGAEGEEGEEAGEFDTIPEVEPTAEAAAALLVVLLRFLGELLEEISRQLA